MADVRTSYPRLPDILDADSLAGIATLESQEKTFARGRGRKRHQYLRALYLKAFRTLGYGHMQPGELPRQLRLCIAEQLGFDPELADIRTLDRRERNRVLAEVRAFLKVSRATPAAKTKIETWLAGGPAQREGDVAVLTNVAIERFRQTAVELPPVADISAMAQRALNAAALRVEKRLASALNEAESAKLMALLEPSGLTVEVIKRPTAAASSNALDAELLRLEQLGAVLPRRAVLAKIPRAKMEQMASLARRYDAAELRDLRPSKCKALLACFVAVRRAQLLDDLAEMFIGTWDGCEANATAGANALLQSRLDLQEQHDSILRDLLRLFRTHRDAESLWRAVHGYSDDNYDKLWDELETSPTWARSYYDKLEDHYGTMRRFLPRWYATMQLRPTTADDSLVKAMELLGQHALPTEPYLTTRAAPTTFLSANWRSRAVRQYAKTGEVLRIIKAPYELGWCEATAKALKSGAVAVAGANRYAPINDHLIARDDFLADFETAVSKLGLPKTAPAYYAPLREQLETKLKDFDARYDTGKRRFWMNGDGTLGFSKHAAQKGLRRAEKLSVELGRRMPEVSIVDVLLDCHRWTSFMDAFVPLGGRQNMPETEKIRYSLAALYAYGCNCGPTQAARSVGVSPSQVIYIRRHYIGTKQLIDAASRLSDAYNLTAMARRLGSEGVLLTDAMHLRTPKRSLTARPYYRDVSHTNILLYQHVTSHCICQFSQSLLCNVSEDIHMLHGVLMCRDKQQPIVCISDCGGKSDLVFGLASLLNIRLFPRIRSRHLKLWVPSKDASLKNLPGPFAGVIRWDWIEEGWQDMMWVLASIAAGTASPRVIFERLAAQPSHPATRGFQELGKLERSNYLLDYGMDMELRRFVVPQTARREHWNRFSRDVLAFGDLVREKDREGQEEVFWYLSTVQNAIVLWNALALEKAIETARQDGIEVREEDLKHVLPTMIGHINFVGLFNLSLRRRPPFKFRSQTLRSA